MVQSDHGVRGPTLSSDMGQWVLWWERQKRSLVEKGNHPWQRNDVIIKFE